MAKVKVEDTQNVITPEQQAASYFKANKDDHYNYEDEVYYKVPSSSLILNESMDGGLPNGASRFIGNTAGGKTSCSLDFMYNFLKFGPGHRGLYVRSEGKLEPETKDRSGISFVTDPNEWKDGNCLIFDCSVYESVFGFIGDLIRNNPTKTRYFIIIDSVDMMAKRDDLKKPLEESGQVAGGALITSVFLKKTSGAIGRRGHICIFISQVRDTIKLTAYAPNDTNRQGKAGGGHAVEHAASWVLDFGAHHFEKSVIRQDDGDKKSKPIGHYCNINIVKSPNETVGQPVSYPIKDGRKNAKSVWIEREVADLLLQYQYAKVSGAWVTIEDYIVKELAERDLEIPAKLNGYGKLCQYLEDTPAVTSYLYDKFKKMIC